MNGRLKVLQAVEMDAERELSVTLRAGDWIFIARPDEDGELPGSIAMDFVEANRRTVVHDLRVGDRCNHENVHGEHHAGYCADCGRDMEMVYGEWIEQEG